MSTTTHRSAHPGGTDARDTVDTSVSGAKAGPLGRLGMVVIDHRRLTAAVWVLLVVGLGIFAPRVEAELSGAGWQADGSESVRCASRGGGALRRQRQLGDPGGRALHRRHLAEGPGADVLAGPPRSSPPTPASPRSSLRSPERPSARTAHRGDPGRRGRRHQRDGARRRRTEGTDCGPRGRRHRGQPDRGVAAVVGLQRGQPRRDDQGGAVLLAGDAGDPGARLRCPRRRRTAAAADPGRAGRLGRVAGPDQPRRAGLDLGDELRDDVRPRARHRLRPVPGRAVPGCADGQEAHAARRRWPRRWTPQARRSCSPGRPCWSHCPQ